MNDSITIQVGLRITKEQINDLMVTALEGGINYWASSASPQSPWDELTKKGVNIASECISVNENLYILDRESDDRYTLSLEKLIKGIKIYLERNPELVSEDVAGFDAEQVDSIIQLSLFDEIVYG